MRRRYRFKPCRHHRIEGSGCGDIETEEGRAEIMLKGNELLEFTLKNRHYNRQYLSYLSYSIGEVYRECRIKSKDWELVRVELKVDVTKEYLRKHGEPT
jgi:hypothetical protein